jgi:hypothetical protein
MAVEVEVRKGMGVAVEPSASRDPAAGSDMRGARQCLFEKLRNGDARERARGRPSAAMF